MSTRRLPPHDNPFRPVRCRDLAILALVTWVTVAAWAVAWIAS
jgi:hypothetical protein